MEIRKLRKEDRFDAYIISAYCFHSRIDDIENRRESVEKETVEDWGAFDDKGELMAHIINNKYDFYIDGSPVKAGGIGAVSTLPEYRNSGAIKEIFKVLLNEAYIKGEVISTLYPFNHSFYRKQGYDTVCYQNNYELSPALLEGYKSDCEVVMWQENDDVEPYLEVYNEFARGYNLAMPRDKESMLQHIKCENRYKDRKFTYLLTKNGHNIAYLTFTDVYNEEGAILKVEELAWIKREGFDAVLSFLGRFDADYGKINLLLPAGVDLLKIIRTRRAYDIKKSSRQDFMVRVVNAEKLLWVIKKPADCDFTVGISDDIIDENNGIWRVKKNMVERIYDNTFKPDLEVSEPSFAQLATGCISLDEAMLKHDVKVNGNEEQLGRVFFDKKIMIYEHF